MTEATQKFSRSSGIYSDLSVAAHCNPAISVSWDEKTNSRPISGKR